MNHMDTRDTLPKSPLFGKHLCVYCGGLADTKDHAPSRCFLRRPLPSNLMTLPACKTCNVRFSTDENIVTIVMALTSAQSDLRRDCEPGGRVHRALERDSRLRSLIESHRRADGNYELSGELLGSFDRVFRKTVQGLFYGLYHRIVPKDELAILSIEDQRFVTPDEVVDRVRPPALRDITDMPLPELTPSSWMVREPVFILDLQPVGPGSEGKSKVQKLFHLVRETPVEWIRYQPGIFTFGFVKAEDGRAVCVLGLWETWVVAVAAPWPDGRGPLRRGKRNPLSRDGRDEPG
jgi:hypothetical protein